MAGIDELTELIDKARAAQRRIPLFERSRKEAQARLDASLSALAEEERDVARLRGISFARFVAVLRGEHEQALDRESAEVAAQQLRVEAAKHQLAAVNAQLRDTVTCASGLRTLEHQEAARADAIAATLSPDDDRAGPLRELEARRVAVTSRIREADEAIRAAAAARAGLQIVAGDLASAGSWSTYDTYFGGGLLATVVKHSRLDDAADHAAAAREALRRLATELADVDVPGDIPLPQITSGTRAIDGWFDNFFTDRSVHSRIRTGQEDIERVLAAVAVITSTVESVRRRARAELVGLEDDRRALLAG